MCVRCGLQLIDVGNKGGGILEGVERRVLPRVPHVATQRRRHLRVEFSVRIRHMFVAIRRQRRSSSRHGPRPRRGGVARVARIYPAPRFVCAEMREVARAATGNAAVLG